MHRVFDLLKERKQLVSLCHLLIENVQYALYFWILAAEKKNPLYPQPSLTKLWDSTELFINPSLTF